MANTTGGSCPFQAIESMLQNLKIEGFKNISGLEMKLAPLTVVTGRNSTGKSSLIQSLLLPQAEAKAAPYYLDYLNLDFMAIRNKYKNAKEISVEFVANNNPVSLKITEAEREYAGKEFAPILEENLFYLSANRIGAENTARAFPEYIKSGPNGAALFSTLEREKSKVVAEGLARYQDSLTLSAQVNYWLSYILDIPLEISLTRSATQEVDVRFKSDDIPGLLPTMLGAGVSYLARILILCLRAKRGDVVMIENPEIHLYPVAQARTAEFLAFVANAGVQVIVETHSNEILTKLRHEVYTGRLRQDDITIAYKNSITGQFEIVDIDNNGRFDPPFPESFFDATLGELLQMD